jgi:hypothetical protein
MNYFDAINSGRQSGKPGSSAGLAAGARTRDAGKRWWENDDEDGDGAVPVPPPPAASGGRKMRNDSADTRRQQPQEAAGSVDVGPASQPVPPAAPGMAATASRRRWWENKDPDQPVAPAQSDPEPDLPYSPEPQIMKPAKTRGQSPLAPPSEVEVDQPVAPPAVERGAFRRQAAARPAPPPLSSEPAEDGVSNLPPSRPQVKRGSYNTVEDYAPQPAGRSQNFRPSHAEDAEDADMNTGAFKRAAPPRRAPAVPSSPELDGEIPVAPEPAPRKGRGLFGRRAAEPEMIDDDAAQSEMMIVQPPPAKKASRGLFGGRGRGGQPKVEEEDIEDIPVPTVVAAGAGLGQATESKRGPRVGAPANVFSKANSAAATRAAKEEHKPIKMPPGPSRLPFDTQDAARKDRQQVEARKRRAAMRSAQQRVRKLVAPVLIIGAFGALLFTGILEIMPANGGMVKINVPESMQPAVSRVQAAVSPVITSVQSVVSDQAQPVMSKVGEALTVPTATPKAANQFDFANGKSGTTP